MSDLPYPHGNGPLSYPRYDITGRLDLNNGIIRVETTYASPNPMMHGVTQVAMKLVETEEKVIKEGLIRLGWTPPEENQEEVYLKDVGTMDDPCWVPCAKGDPGAVLFRSVGYG